MYFLLLLSARSSDFRRFLNPPTMGISHLPMFPKLPGTYTDVDEKILTSGGKMLLQSLLMDGCFSRVGSLLMFSWASLHTIVFLSSPVLLRVGLH